MNGDLGDIEFRKRAEAYRLALAYTEKMAAFISSSIDECNHQDIERADYFSKMALRHAMQAENYLSTTSK